MTPRRPALALAAVLCLAAGVQPLLAQSPSNFTYNGVVHVSWWWNEYNNFDQPTGPATDSRNVLATTRANWAGLLVTQYQDNISSNVIVPRYAEMKTPTDASLRFAIQELHARNIKVMLKPHVDLWADSSHWRGQINPTDPAAWFQSYTQFILHYAQLAQEQGVEGFVVGTELVMMTGSAHNARWNAVIDAVRANYSGLITYAANATFPADEFTSVSFWDRVDVMGLDGYFTLTNHASPTLAELTAAWSSNANGENLVAAIQNFASAHGKPVIFTELGYKSVSGANTQPWNSGLGGPYNPTEQRNCYEAAFSVWSTRTAFMKGIFWWAWPVPAPGANDLDYNPRTKPAEDVLRTWQGTATPNFTLGASPASLTVVRGTSSTSAIAITRTSFAASVTLSASGLPSGVTAAFAPTSTTGNASTLTLTASTTATTGTSVVTVTGTGGGLTRSTTLSLTVNPVAQSNFTLSATPAALTVNPGGSGSSAIAIARTNFTGGVSLGATGLPAGVTASLSPSSTTGNTSTLLVTASPGVAAGASTVTVTGTGGGLTRTATVSLTVTGTGGGNGGVAVTPVVSTSSAWFNEEQVRLTNTATLTALTITVVIQRTTGISASGQYNTVGGQIQQGNSSTATAITYQFALAPGQTLGTGSGRIFAAQTSGTGTSHPTAGDTWIVSYTTGGQTFTQNGTF